MLLSPILLLLAMTTSILAKNKNKAPNDCTDIQNRINTCTDRKGEWCPVIGCQDLCIEDECHKFDDWGNKQCVRECFVRDEAPY